MALLTCLMPGCENEIDPHDRKVAWEVIGGEREREAGGTNHLLFRKRTGRAWCPTCVTRLQHSGNALQQQLV
jgi:hypothetical protein